MTGSMLAWGAVMKKCYNCGNETPIYPWHKQGCNKSVCCEYCNVALQLNNTGETVPERFDIYYKDTEEQKILEKNAIISGCEILNLPVPNLFDDNSASSINFINKILKRIKKRFGI